MRNPRQPALSWLNYKAYCTVYCFYNQIGGIVCVTRKQSCHRMNKKESLLFILWSMCIAVQRCGVHGQSRKHVLSLSRASKRKVFVYESLRIWLAKVHFYLKISWHYKVLPCAICPRTHRHQCMEQILSFQCHHPSTKPHLLVKWNVICYSTTK